MNSLLPDEAEARFMEMAHDAPEPGAGLALLARALILRLEPDTVEVVWPTQRTAGYGVGPKKMSEHFAYIGLHRDWANLGFLYGSELPDPAGLLGGEGKRIRHLRITAPSVLDHSALHALIGEARRDVLRRLGRR